MINKPVKTVELGAGRGADVQAAARLVHQFGNRVRKRTRSLMTPQGTSADLSRGQCLAKLFLDSKGWVHRRVDALTLASDGTTRRAISFDVEIPPEFKIEGSEKRVLVPLALIEKGALRKVSTEDPAGHPLPVFGAWKNTKLAVEMLQALVPGFAVGSAAYEKQLSVLNGIVFAPASGMSKEDRQKREAATAEFNDWLSNLSEAEGQGNRAVYLETFRRLALSFLDHFLLAVEVKEEFVGTRCVLKFAYERDLPILDEGNFIAATRMIVPDIGFARSQHIEVSVPPGLSVRELQVVDLVDDEAVAKRFDTPDGERSTAHVALAAAERTSVGQILIEMTPVGPGIHSFTRMGLAIIAALVALGLAEKWDWVSVVAHDYRIPSQSASVLLIGPALFLSWMARAPEHDAVALLLRPLRLVLMYCTVVLLVLAAAAAVPLTPDAWETVWQAAFGGTVLAVVSYFAYAWNIPRGIARAQAWSIAVAIATPPWIMRTGNSISRFLSAKRRKAIDWVKGRLRRQR
ncbi:hypothetical protein J2T11_003273 [Paenarthrobacter nicotinovorans]|uniref:hypothetical protein n=1 Tax=Paenarthrobacter nicotinovorans TaxID=29320 RepID=UPI00278544A0|nr:hypothetical protein [Paenarthrobacter nicotinovorans]MDP9936905.1 hypothetical protein [Paenarthrobacter nicotinovorans]